MRFRRHVGAVLMPIFLLIGQPQPALACFSQSFAHDTQGDTVSVNSSNPNGASITYGYDVLNRLGNVADAHLGSTTYNYDAVGNLGGFNTPNGVIHNYAYDSLNRLRNLSLLRMTDLLHPFASYTYTVAPNGQRLSETGLNGRKSTYTYDTLNRLTSETITGDTTGQNGVIGYQYDPVGNRLARTSTVAALANQSFTYDANDRLASDTYDANGNTTASQITTGTNGVQSASQTVGDSYDSENHLTNRNTGTVQIVYDGDGNRVRETQAGVTTSYLVDDLNPTGYAQVLEEVVNGSVTRSYTYGHDLLSQDIHNINTDTWSAVFNGYDGHGSVRLLTDQNGGLIESYNYDAFGNLLGVINPLTSQPTGNGPLSKYLYSGEQLDSGLGLYYLRARYMNAASGRFWTMDSYEGNQGDPASLHKFLYCSNNPIVLRDPSGLLFLPSNLEYGNVVQREIADAFQSQRGYGNTFVLTKTINQILGNIQNTSVLHDRTWLTQMQISTP